MRISSATGPSTRRIRFQSLISSRCFSVSMWSTFDAPDFLKMINKNKARTQLQALFRRWNRDRLLSLKEVEGK
jgi:hypothetical protein